MDQVTLRAEVGREKGSRASRRLRRSGLVPAIVYGRGLETRTIAVDRRDLYGVLHTEAGLNALITLQVEGDEYLTVAREVQRHPVRGEIDHLDFLQISLDEVIQAEVGIEFTGEAEGTLEGGVIETVNNSVMIEALPTAIPNSIQIDISELNIGDTLKVSDLPEVEGVTYISDEDMSLVTVVIPAALIVEEPEEELEEGEEALEGEEGEEGEEGAAEASAEGAEAEDQG
jgi:large subunit ribosomal protein L25